MALRAQSTGSSCKLNNVAPPTDMYRVSGRAQTSSPRTTSPSTFASSILLRSPHCHATCLPLSLSRSLARPTALILFSLHDEDRDTRNAYVSQPLTRDNSTPGWKTLSMFSILRFLDHWIRIIRDLSGNFIVLASFPFFFFLRKIFNVIIIFRNKV